MEHGSFAWSISGLIALLASILCLQGKLGLVPFDQAEAETEIMGGALVEYSGPPLAMFKLAKAMMLVAMPVFILAVLWGGLGSTVSSFILGLIKFVVLIVIVTLIRNTNPRVRIDHALKFFWGFVSVFAVLAVILAVLGV
jgi:NADH-quinone oxidoreductase subunit H